ncbi:BON domain-containing protein [Ferrovibrio sp. MS7]|uniref:BON domain-containing protein n=1 Tax=Ferrovibrio plantarum TaxID=3119164 RepID=UPI003136C161
MTTSHTLRMLAAAAALLAVTGGLAACSSTPRQESTGEYVDSAAITTKVKTAILNEPSLKSMQISVETFKDSVQLSGFVDSSANRSKAGELARNVEGVKSVKNDLVVK